MTLWEEDIGSMEQGNSYKLQGVTVREFRGKHFLSTSKDISQILQADDIGSVNEEEDDENEITDRNTSTIKNARIVGVLDMQTYSSCIKCASKVIADETDEDLCECVKCTMSRICSQAAVHQNHAAISNESRGLLGKLSQTS